MAHSCVMTKREEKGKATSDSEHPVRNLNDRLLRNLRRAIAQGRALQEEEIDLLVAITRRGNASQEKNCDHWHPPCCMFHNRNQCRSSNTCLFVPLTADRSPIPKGKAKGDEVKVSSVAEDTKARGNSLHAKEEKSEAVRIVAKGNLE